MKRYLMRGGVNPLEVMSVEDIILRNLIGANSGNLLYAFGVYRTLMTEDVVIDMDYYGVERSYTDKDIAEINEKYDAYICPLADAFRDAFTDKLWKYAKFFDKLTIPCYVIGMGLRSPYDGQLPDSYVFDEAAKAFVKAVLKKSGMIGLRGATTAKYLTRLGFQEDKDFMVIGCPSMYTCGAELPYREVKLDENGMLAKDTKISFNMSSITSEDVMKFLFSQIERFPEHYCVEQNEAELRMLYLGLDYVTKKVAQDSWLPLSVSHPLLQEDRYKVFVNVATWRNFMQGMDLSVGSKLHGNVSALISGCPAIFLPLDGRMNELIDYHAFPAVRPEQLEEGETIESLMGKVDLKSYLRPHRENFDRFLYFLNQNSLDHIYKEDPERKVAPVDLAMQKLEYPEVTSILNCTGYEAAQRFNRYYKAEKGKSNKKYNALNTKYKKVDAELKTIVEKQKHLEAGKLYRWVKKVFLLDN